MKEHPAKLCECCGTSCGLVFDGMVYFCGPCLLAQRDNLRHDLTASTRELNAYREAMADDNLVSEVALDPDKSIRDIADSYMRAYRAAVLARVEARVKERTR